MTNVQLNTNGLWFCNSAVNKSLRQSYHAMKAGLYGLPFQEYLEPWQLAYKKTLPWAFLKIAPCGKFHEMPITADARPAA